MKPAVASFQIQKLHSNEGRFESKSTTDLCAVEEPLEIRIGYGPENDRVQTTVAVTMRTPGHDFELTIGFLFTEGVLKHLNDLLSIKHCADTNNNQQYNIVRIEIKPNVCIELKNIERNFYTTSSCGICGKASIEAIKLQPQMLSNELPPTVTADTILKLPHILRQQQNVFEYTGGLHACALFTTAGKLILAREDVGRHNALDKLIGAALGSNINFNNHLMMLSGRASFELLQKAAMAGIKIVCAVGAPSNLAIETAQKFDITLIGFLRENRFNIYNNANTITY